MSNKVKAKRVYKKKLAAIGPIAPEVKDISTMPWQECVNIFGVGGTDTKIPFKAAGWTSYISLYPVPSGCGLKILRGNSGLGGVSDQELEVIKKEIERRHPKDTIAATLGDDHFKALNGEMHYEVPLIKLGFVKAISYPNWQHGKSYKQHMYLKYPRGYNPDGK